MKDVVVDPPLEERTGPLNHGRRKRANGRDVRGRRNDLVELGWRIGPEELRCRHAGIAHTERLQPFMVCRLNSAWVRTAGEQIARVQKRDEPFLTQRWISSPTGE